MRITSLLALLVGAAAPGALAQSNPPLMSVNMTEVDVVNSNGSIANTFGGNPIYGTGGFNPLNGGTGAYTETVYMWALATGTFPAGGFTYTFFVNGETIGTAINVPSSNNDAYPQAVAWNPPQPGVYYFSATAAEGGLTATSLAVEYFATGISIVSPLPNSIVPLGSSVVIQAAAAINEGAVSKVAFYADGVLLGTSVNYPYSIIYTPPGPVSSVHFIKAVSYLSDGVTVAGTTALQGIVVVSPVTPLPSCSIGSPAQTSPPTTIPIPNYSQDPSAYIPVTVNAGSAGTIQKVELYINGVLFGTDTALPYNFNWSPTVGGTYTLTALAYDAKDNVIASTTSSSPTLTPQPTTVIVGSLPSIAITSPTNGATLSGGSVSAITATATDNNVDSSGSPVAIAQVQFFQDGSVVGTAPGVAGVSVYTISFTPTQRVNSTTGQAESSELEAIATDALGFQGISPQVTVTVTAGGSSGSVVLGIPPTVSLTAPAQSATVVVNTPVTLNASATAPNGNVASVSFLVDSVALSTATKYPYSVVWTPGNLGTYTITAQVIDNLGDKTNSAPITVTVVAPPPPVVSITAPTAGSVLTVDTPVTVTASATSASGTISQVQISENGVAILPVLTSPPYTVSFTPQSAGVYTLTAVATDNAGQVATSSTTVTVVVPPPPAVSITAPTSGSLLTVGTAVNVTAIASSSTGTISKVQIFQDGIAISPVLTSPPYTVSFTPLSTGIYTLTAVATDYANQVTTSSSVVVEAAPATTGPSTVAYFGNYQGVNSEWGVFGLIVVDGASATYIGLQQKGTSTSPAYLPDINVSSSGALSSPTNSITGTVASLGANGTLSGGEIFIGAPASTTGSVTVSSGYYAGDITGQANSTFIAIVGSDGEIMAYVSNGAFSDVGYGAGGSVDSTGAFSIRTKGNNTLVGSVDPVTALLTATLSGSNGGQILGGLVSGGTFSDGVMKNLSTRGVVGSDDLVAGFYVAGSATKTLLVRGIGPALSGFGVSGALPATELTIADASGTKIAANSGWSSTPALQTQVAAAEASAGAFGLTVGSLDSAYVGAFPPGAYTATVSGASGDTGVALVEVWDLDAYSPFTANKLVNLSTRGFVGTGIDVLVGGFYINGNSPKKLLIRGAGPGLTALGVSGALSAPHLQIFNSSGSIIRENYSWGDGNDPGLVMLAAKASGAFAFASGSADSAILIVLDPGSYTVELSGTGGATGNALVEVYEVP